MADIWPIENVWAIMKRGLSAQKFVSYHDMCLEIVRLWREINAFLCYKMMLGIPERLQAVIANGGRELRGREWKNNKSPKVPTLAPSEVTKLRAKHSRCQSVGCDDDDCYWRQHRVNPPKVYVTPKNPIPGQPRVVERKSAAHKKKGDTEVKPIYIPKGWENRAPPQNTKYVSSDFDLSAPVSMVPHPQPVVSVAETESSDSSEDDDDDAHMNYGLLDNTNSRSALF